MDVSVLSLALVAGAVAAFNPCGFALLPAYVSMLVSSSVADHADVGRRTSQTAAGRAVRFTSGMTVGFVIVFGLFGVLAAAVASSVNRYLPYVTVLVGVGLVLLGLWLLAGHTLSVPRMPGRRRAPNGAWLSQVGYGVTFALASLSCTIAPFLAVTSASLTSGSAAGVLAAFVAYALGMATVVGVLAVAAVTATSSVTVVLRRAVPLISRLSGALLVLAGAYVAWYGWFELRVLSGSGPDDPIVSAATQLQSAVSRAVAGLGATTLAVLGGALVLAVVLSVVRSRQRTARRAQAVGVEPDRDRVEP